MNELCILGRYTQKQKLRHRLDSAMIWIRELIDRYEQWGTELEKLGEPYYLKIWIYDKMFFESQIVAAIRERILWYDQLFEPSEKKLSFPFHQFIGNVQNESSFAWNPVNEISYLSDEDEFTKENGIRNLVWVGSRQRGS